VIPAPPQEVIYDKPAPARVKYIETHVPHLCPVFVPVSYSSLPNEGIQRVDILQVPDVPIGFQDMRYIDQHALSGHHQGPITTQLPQSNSMQINNIQVQSFPQMQNVQSMQSFPQAQNLHSSASNDIAISGWMPMGPTR
jgi:hypothetical protein